MDVEFLRSFCKGLPGVTEDIKWENDLCFMVGGKMFCVARLDAPLAVSFKVLPEEFVELTSSPGIIPAPYVGRYNWVLVEKSARLSRPEWERYVKQSYHLVKARLPGQARKKRSVKSRR